jgi:hypothetical protein
MLPNEFLKTIYLGDRACKSITIDGWGNRILIQVDEISRVRSASGRWEYYNDENIVNGLLVFTDVRSVQFDPAGPVPNDYMDKLEPSVLPDGYWQFRFSVGSVNKSAKSKDVIITIEAMGLHLEDPANPGVAIKD